MSAAQQSSIISIDDYLSGELASEVKHEYVDGIVFAMTGGTTDHSRIASRVTVSLGRQLEGTPCEPFNSDLKIRIKRHEKTFFYYPDVSVLCAFESGDSLFQDSPSVIVEVLSEGTRRADQGEKRDNYLAIPTLQTYVMLEQTNRRAIVYQRTNPDKFDVAVYDQVNAIIPLPGIHAELAFDEIYRGIKFE